MSETVGACTKCPEELADSPESQPPLLKRYVVRREELSQLELLPAVVHRKIIKMVGISELKALRLTSITLRGVIEKEERVFFKVWDLDEIFLERSYGISDMKRLFADVKIVKGLKFSLRSETSDDMIEFVKSIREDHPELEDMHLRFKMLSDEKLLRCSFAAFGPILKSLHLDYCFFESELTPLDKGCLPCLQEFTVNSMRQDYSTITNACSQTLRKLVLVGDYYRRDKEHLYHNTDFPLLEHLEFNKCLNVQGIAQLLNRLAIRNITGEKLGSKLKVLKLQYVEYESLRSIPQSFFEDLEELDFSYTYMNDDQLASILSQVGKKLKVLKLSHSEITGEVFNKMSSNSFPQLEVLDMCWCLKFDDFRLEQFLSKFGTSIKVLVLKSTSITGENFTMDLSFCPQVETLDVQFCRDLRDEGFISIIKKMGTKLKTLNVSNTYIGEDGFIRLCLHSIKLEALAMSHCNRLTDNMLLLLLKQHGESLKELDISYTSVSGEGFSEVGLSLPKLKTLKMSNRESMMRMEEHTLREILSTCGSLKKLSISPIFFEYVTELKSKGIVIKYFE